jgi:hypothetical protein
MERKKQICEAGQQYLNSMDEFQRYHTYPKGAFIDGAKWADENPKKGLVSLDKVCEMLYAMLSTQEIHNYDYVTASAYDNVEDFVEDFRKVFEK